jgi:hypothetical protein
MDQIYNTTVDLKIGTNEGLQLLALQKRELMFALHEGKVSEVLEGLVNLIDHIQDELNYKNGVPEKAIYPYS